MELDGSAQYSHETDSEIVFIMPEDDKQITVKKTMINFSNKPVYIEHEGQIILLDMKDRPSLNPDRETKEIQCKTSSSDGLSDEEVDPDEPKVDGSWTYSATKLFLTLYREKKPMVDKRKIITAKRMWEIISMEMTAQGFKFTNSQAENKWKSLERAYKKAVNNAGKKIRGRFNPFERELAEILQDQGNNFSQDLETSCSDRLSEAEVDPNEPKPEGYWTDVATRIFLTMYREQKPSLLEKKKGQTAKKMWEFISEQFGQQGYKFTPLQVENKWKSLERAYRRAVAKNETTVGTRSGKKTCPYEKELTEILQEQGNISTPAAKGIKRPLMGQSSVLRLNCLIPEDCLPISTPPAASTSTSTTCINSSPNVCTCCCSQSPSGTPNGKRIHYELKEMRAAILKRQEQRDTERREMEAKKIELKRQLVEQAKLKNSLLQTLIESLKKEGT